MSLNRYQLFIVALFGVMVAFGCIIPGIQNRLRAQKRKQRLTHVKNRLQKKLDELHERVVEATPEESERAFNDYLAALKQLELTHICLQRL